MNKLEGHIFLVFSPDMMVYAYFLCLKRVMATSISLDLWLLLGFKFLITEVSASEQKLPSTVRKKIEGILLSIMKHGHSQIQN